MKVDPYGAEPLYIQLAAVIRGEIQALEPLARLSSEAWYTQEYGVSRDTVRRAMELLEEEGLIFGLGQRGRFVGPKPS